MTHTENLWATDGGASLTYVGQDPSDAGKHTWTKQKIVEFFPSDCSRRRYYIVWLRKTG
jgi:hypothetical protein